VTVKLYDLSEKPKRLISTFEQYTSGGKQTSLTGTIDLDRESFGVNKKILVVMSDRQRILAEGTLEILGKPRVNSGKVDFTKE